MMDRVKQRISIYLLFGAAVTAFLWRTALPIILPRFAAIHAQYQTECQCSSANRNINHTFFYCKPADDQALAG